MAAVRPSIHARITPPPTADLKAVEAPNRAARTPLVTKPEAMAFHGSSFPRRAAKEQSNDENMAPQIPKLPVCKNRRDKRGRGRKVR